MSNSTNPWQSFLAAQGAQFDAQGAAIFAASTVGAQLFDLSSSGLIAISGADSETFLQGQVTNDIKLLAQGAQFNGYCSPKGRLLALFYSFSLNDVIYLQCPRALIADLVKRLRMYVLRSKVLVEDASDRLLTFGLASDTLATSMPQLPTAAHQLAHDTHGTLIRLTDAGKQQRALLVVSHEQAQASWLSLSAIFAPASTTQWEALEVQAGIPQVYAATKEQFVPQMINLDALNGINFKKGCYTGQEIVARTHYLGKVKRRTMLAQLSAGEHTPQAGDVLHDAQQQEAGLLVRVAPATNNGWWVLAECRLEAQAAGAINWQGQPLAFQDLPYALP
ncbi:folate-binding protein YgfZ [Methylophilus sp. 5]|uniref:CAF17-like 4Fe-4S cluster assembly/insertion protein YgfZ n=1 Tax=Methylophilus sp. 5 TaxID=1112274 RepID=UPI000490972D|nr:folate-binding protein YgfZ [Methylophilus sp. 5]